MKIIPEVLKNSFYGWNCESTILFTTGSQDGTMNVEVPGVHLRLYIDRKREPMVVLVAKTMRWQLINEETRSGSVIQHFSDDAATRDYYQIIQIGSASRATEAFIAKQWDTAKAYIPELVSQAYSHYINNGTEVPFMYWDTAGDPCFCEEGEFLGNTSNYVTTCFETDPYHANINRIYLGDEESTWVVLTEHGFCEVEEHDDFDPDVDCDDD